ncbi:mucin-4 isoform X3 [Phlebotomus papatasi]|uniref:mucin-4 isoform X3 n=1 Tax=Phlebotomus papatasi TaxID=29031 RepID=UPI0024843971|nr:mucin-4 isoform X3 [Phlebotomus papatasi]
MTITETNQASIPQLTNGDDNSKSNATSKSEKTPTKGDDVKSGDDEERHRREFVKELRISHENKGTPFARFPKISGKEVDLYKLYVEVTSRGGWLKVNQRNDWDEVLEEVGFPNSIVNAPVAIKYIYLRYLDRYEKLHFHGEENERADDEDDENRHKRWNARLLHNVPNTYNYHQHAVSDSQRAQHKLSTDLYKSSEYDKLFLSLMSPLPNEQDFAINVCTLMSNEGKHTLKIERCPKLIDILLAHAGLFQHYTMREIFTEYYSKIRKHSLQTFWNDCLQDKPQILELSFDDYFTSSDDKLVRAAEILSKNLHRQIRPDYVVDVDEEADRDCSLEVAELNFLSLGRGLGTHEYVGQRITQISTIIRNLSFIEDNVGVLARNRTLVRFLVMSANIRWSNLHHMGLDILGNLALELDLSDPSTDDLTRCLLSTITEGLESQDRGVIISCLEVLYKLCQKSSNEDHLHKCLDKKVYRQVCLYLSLNDIMLLLYTLECIYALSLLGERSCNAIVQVRGVVDTLVSLVTVEAQSYGADGCILMRVVETVPGNANLSSLASHHIINSSSVVNLQQGNLISHSSSGSSTHSLTTLSQQEAQKICTSIPPLVANSSPIKATVPSQVVSNAAVVPVGMSSPKMTHSTPSVAVVNANSNTATNVVVASMDSQASQQNSPTVAAKHAQQQLIQENEQFALAWLRATFEPAANLNTRIEQQELYKMYITASSKLGRRGVVSPVHFPRCVRSVFGGSVGPNPMKLDSMPSESPQFYYEGIKIRAKPLPVVHKGIIVSTLQKPQHALNHQHPENHVIVVSGNQSQQITNVNSAIVKPLINANQSSVVPQIASTTVSSTVPSTSTSSSSLIKSLLANKVTSPVNDQSAGSSVSTCLIAPNVNLHQVAQRQHLQKQKELAQQKQTGNGALPTTVINQGSNATVTPIKANITVKGPIGTNVISGPILLEKKLPQDDHAGMNNWDPVPPLAPLSGVQNQRAVIVSAPVKIDDDSDSTGNNSVASSITSINQNAFVDDAENSLTSFEGVLVQNNQSSACSTEDENSSKDSLNKASHVVSANKMLADLLERKSLDPPLFGGGSNSNSGENSLKRRLDSGGGDSSEESSPPAKKANSTNAASDVITIDSNEEEDEAVTVAPSANAAKLFAELAASALEDEDLEEDVVPQTEETAADVKVQTPAAPTKTVIVEKKVEGPSTTGQMITVPVPLQRQIIMSPGAQPQMILSQGGTASLGTPTTATIKTESGYQTVPVILQHSAGGTNQIQLTKTGQLVQPVQLATQPQTQYVLATNPQGQTYVVAAPQASHPLQTLLLQSPQQQGTGTKTIIILQQPSGAGGGAVTTGTPQKIIMTQQGQQMVVTQMQRPVQHHVIVNQLPNNQTTSITSTPTIQPSVTLNTVVSNAQPSGASAGVVVEKKAPQQIIVTTQQPALAAVSSAIASPPTTNTANVTIVQKAATTEAESPAPVSTAPTQSQATIVTTKEAGKVTVQVTTNIQQNSVQNPANPPQSPSPQLSAGSKGPSPTPQTTTPAAQPTKPAETATSVKPEQEEVEASWLWVCDWRGCPRKKFRSANEVYIHACNAHCPNGLDPTAEIYCQWGPGPNLCDNLPRKRFSLMTHLFDRHCTTESFKMAVQRRLTCGVQNSGTHQTHPVTLIKNTGSPNTVSSAASASGDGGTASPALSTSSSSSLTSALPSVAGSAAMQAIKRHHSMEFVNPKELMDDNEGPVTKSIRLTASLILRNLVNYSGSAKR